MINRLKTIGKYWLAGFSVDDYTYTENEKRTVV